MSSSDVRRRERILKGNLFQAVLFICLPLAVYQLFNSAYNLIDQVICAQISTPAQNVVASIGQLKNAISAFGGGLAAGGAVFVSRFFGAGKIKDAKHASANLLFLSIVVSVVLMILLIPLAKPIMQLCQIAPESIEIGIGFFRLQLLELAFIGINNVFIGLEKAKGNSKSILKLNVLVLIVKMALTCLFIFGFNLKDIIYVEIATIIGQATLTGIGVFVLFGKKNILQISIKNILPKSTYIVPILKYSIPIFFGKFIMSMGKVVVNGLCGNYWNAATDGLIVGTLGVSNNMCGLITSPTNTFEEGESTIVSQNLGNRNLKRAIKAFSRTLILVGSISIVGYVLMRFVFIDHLVELFTSSDELSDTYKSMVKEIFKYDSLSILALGFNAAVLGLLYGFGKTGLSTVLNFSRIGSRIVILIFLHNVFPDLSPTTCAGLSMGISNTVILVLSVVFLVIFLINLKKKGYNGIKLTDPEPEVSELILD